MAAQKLYKDADFYEKKLHKVMDRFSITDYDWDFNRKGAYVTFYYKGQFYRFDHTVEKARESGNELNYGSDCFAQIVLALEDLVRIVNRGIYDLQSWVAGMKSLPETSTLSWYFAYLGLTEETTDEVVIEKAYKNMAKVYHPDKGGSEEAFIKLQEAKELALSSARQKGV